MQDLYDRLGIARTASQAEIKSAYRKLAKRWHPDMNPGDRQADQRFQEATQAYDILSDAAKRRQYDAGEIDANGRQRPRFTPGFRNRANQAYSRHGPGHAGAGQSGPAGGGASGSSSAGGGEQAGAEDIFADLFGGGFGRRGGGARSRVRSKGADVSYTVTVDFLEAAAGGSRRVRLTDGKTLEMTIPPGTEEGQTLRLRGQGMQGLGGGEAGDALVSISVAPHPRFTREGKDIHLTLPVSLQEAVLGGSVEAPTIHGKVSMKIPAGANSGRKLRLRERGVTPRDGAPGDQYVTLQVTLPDSQDPELKRFVADWGRKHPYNPRKD